MILHRAELIDDMVSFSFSEGKSHVQMQLPYWKLQNWVKDYPLFSKWNLHDMTEQYVQHMFNLAELLS